MKKISAIFAISIFIASCSKDATFVKFIENNSNQTITMKIISSDIGWVDSTVVVYPYQKIELYRAIGSGTRGSCEINIDSLLLTIASGDTLKKDFLNAEDWTMTQEAQRIGIELYQECIFGIGEEDF